MGTERHDCPSKDREPLYIIYLGRLLRRKACPVWVLLGVRMPRSACIRGVHVREYNKSILRSGDDGVVAKNIAGSKSNAVRITSS